MRSRLQIWSFFLPGIVFQNERVWKKWVFLAIFECQNHRTMWCSRDVFWQHFAFCDFGLVETVGKPINRNWKKTCQICFRDKVIGLFKRHFSRRRTGFREKPTFFPFSKYILHGTVCFGNVGKLFSFEKKNTYQKTLSSCWKKNSRLRCQKIETY